MTTIIYFVLKGVLLIAMAPAIVLYEPLQKHWFFLSVLYTGLLAALSWLFILNMHPGIPADSWKVWLLMSFGLVALYFKLLTIFDEGFLFWVIFLGGLAGLLWF